MKEEVKVLDRTARKVLTRQYIELHRWRMLTAGRTEQGDSLSPTEGKAQDKLDLYTNIRQERNVY